MKLPFTICDWRFTIEKQSVGAVRPLTAGAHGVTRPTASNRQSSVINHKSRQGIALVITLILISVTLLMALAFLAISSRERGAVAAAADTANARLAADAALASAEAQIVANAFTAVAATNSPNNYGLLVSTNFINGNGFQPGVVNPDNVKLITMSTAFRLPALISFRTSPISRFFRACRSI